MKNLQEKKRGIPSKQVLYQLTSAHAKDAIKCLADVMMNGDNDNARIGAAKVLLNKCIPDLKSVELGGEGGKTLIINFTVSSEEAKKRLEQLYAGSIGGDD